MSLPTAAAASTRPWDAGLERVGIFGIHLFALFALLGSSVAAAGLLLFLVAFVLRFRDWPRLGRDPLALVCALVVLYVGLHSLVFYLALPPGDMADDVAETGASWAKLVLLIPFAYWAAADPVRIRRVLLLLLLGFTLGFLRKIDWAAFDAAFFQTRFENYLPGNVFGMFAGLGVLGLVVFRRRFFGEGSRGTLRLARVILWVLLLAVLLEGLLLSFSRGSWLAFVAAALLYLWQERQRGAGRRHGAALLAFGALFALLAAAHWGSIEVRLREEIPILEQVVQGDLEGLQHRSVGIRVLGWRYGFSEWLQHPWFGLGAGTSRHRIAASGRPELLMYGQYWLPHLHNTYLEILYQLGVVGLVLIASLLWVLARGTAAERRAGRLPEDLFLFLQTTLVFALIWALFDYRAVRQDWVVFWIIAAGSAYSFRLRTLLADPAAAEGTAGTRP